MNNKPDRLVELLRCAVASQIALGESEVIINRKSSKVSIDKSDIQTAIKPVESGELFPVTAGELIGKPEYESSEAHRLAICNCLKCPLGHSRGKFVYGVGNTNADLIFIGEGPGREEDLQGEPFVGRAGKLLDKILEAINFTRDEVYIANIIKCRPPENRDPSPEEMDACMPYLMEQLRLIKPRLICALGRVAAQALLQTSTPLGKLRGQWHDYKGMELMVTYHPAALLRFPGYKKDTWEDMKTLRSRYDELKR